MKMPLSIALLAAALCSLCSCKVNWFGSSYDVAWYWIAIPVVIIAVLAFVLLMSTVFCCPYCGTLFRPKWYQLSVTIHMGRRRLATCPCCKKRGFFPKAKR